jgi:hypothetical protein
VDVIGCLCVSLGSSTVQLHDNIGSRRACACSEAGFSSKNVDRAWGICYRRAAFCCEFFLWANGLSAKDIHKEMIYFYGGKYFCRVKWFITGWHTFRWWRRGWNGGAKFAETIVKRLLCWGFRRTGRVMGQVYQCWWRICREINVFFSTFEYHVFHVLYPFVTYLLTLPSYITNLPISRLTAPLELRNSAADSQLNSSL